MAEAPTQHHRGRRHLAGCVAISFAAFTAGPSTAKASPAGAIIDPYGPSPVVAPLDPYATPRPPRLLPAPTLPQQYPPPMPYGAPIDPYGQQPYGQYPYGQYPYGQYQGRGYPPLPPPPLPQAPPPMPAAPAGCYASGCPDMLAYRPVPPTVTEMRPRYGVMAAGISILGGLWILSSASGVLSEHNELSIPIAGPILTAVELNHDYVRSASLSTVTGILVMDALLQTTGLIMAIAGGASRVAVTRRAPQRPPTYPSVSPYGAGVSGRF